MFIRKNLKEYISLESICILEDNIIMDLSELGREAVDWIQLAKDKINGGRL
jgi:hypothetical protein